MSKRCASGPTFPVSIAQQVLLRIMPNLSAHLICCRLLNHHVHAQRPVVVLAIAASSKTILRPSGTSKTVFRSQKIYIRQLRHRQSKNLIQMQVAMRTCGPGTTGSPAGCSRRRRSSTRPASKAAEMSVACLCCVSQSHTCVCSTPATPHLHTSHAACSMPVGALSFQEL